MTNLKISCTIVLWSCLLNIAFGQPHEGESQMLPDERMTLDDCHLRFYNFWPFGGGGAGGFPARSNEFAHMGAIGWIQADGSMKWQCGGTLIWDNFVMTAAHCVVDSNNQKPQVVRFGDLNLYTTDGDETAQQIEIAEIIRHPLHRYASHYHDIALLRLKESVQINPSVCPACLWTSDEVRFTKLEATGWGSTGFGENVSPILLKMTLSPVTESECRDVYGNNTHRKLKSGIQGHQICAWDEKADTCEGDSGGPLQVKLMHGMRVTPFVVGVTSFGFPCGRSTPGVYTRVSTYFDWIKQTMVERRAPVAGDILNSTMCTLRYAELRDFYDGVVTSRNGSNVELNVFLRHINVARSRPGYMVRLGWQNGSELDNCYGILVDDEYVLTLASCAQVNGTKVDRIVEPRNLKLSQVHIHPRYSEGSSYFNVALLKLENLLNFQNSWDLSMTCMWHAYNLPGKALTAVGFGRTDLNEPLYPGNSLELDPSIGVIESENTIQNRSTCRLPPKNIPRMEHGLAHEHLCTGNDFFLVPDACELPPGTPLKGTEWRNDRPYSMVFAINQPGSRDCGFGEHALSTRLYDHLEWMRLVMLPGYRSLDEVLQYVEKDLSEGEECELAGEKAGKCVPVAKCVDNWSEFSALGSMLFCSSLETICCPNDVIARRNVVEQHVESEIRECPALMRGFKHDSLSVGSLAILAFETEDSYYELECFGALISKQFLVTTASCLYNRIPDAILLQGLGNENNGVEPLSFVQHENYDPETGSFDIALVKLKNELTWSSAVYPVCLWMNQTHTPLVTRQIFLNSKDKFEAEHLLSMYNTDCQRYHPESAFPRTRMCARAPGGLNNCKTMAAGILAAPDKDVSYLIGMEQDDDGCVNTTLISFMRIAPLVGWIENQIKKM
ncbi:uncharacterized protein LOC129748866 [Uranotaenia lowii]|uniref:uncharacterized protein LOC129748866 n=1 Tax=Uranotaenia lowii TaxID=190385 RepID=UPI002479290C|nr:uncharacterized protein LOC129748866 [Uranotaenia lowii]